MVGVIWREKDDKMANMQSPEKMRLGLLIDRRVAARLDKAARSAHLSRNAYANALLDDALAAVRLTDEEKEKIENEIQRIRRSRRY